MPRVNVPEALYKVTLVERERGWVNVSSGSNTTTMNQTPGLVPRQSQTIPILKITMWAKCHEHKQQHL